MLEKIIKKARKLAQTVGEVQGFAVGQKVIAGKRQADLPAIVFFVDRKKPASGKGKPKKVLPRFIGRMHTDVVEVGKIEALGNSVKPQEYKQRFRPKIPCGVSIGHPDITAGTLGLYAIDENTGHTVIVTNAHVGAAVNSGRPGDPLLQPGPYDGGTAEDQIGVLLRSVPIHMDGNGGGSWLERLLKMLWDLLRGWLGFGVKRQEDNTNYVDLALIEVEPQYVDKRILGQLNYPYRWADAKVGDDVAKSGRTTEYKKDRCLYTNAEIQVSYGDDGMATFRDQDVHGPISAGGDSGSVITKAEGAIVCGLLFAGSNQVTIANPWRHVIENGVKLLENVGPGSYSASPEGE